MVRLSSALCLLAILSLVPVRQAGAIQGQSFGYPRFVDDTVVGPDEPVVGDFDGDSHPDLAAGTFEGIVVLRNTAGDASAWNRSAVDAVDFGANDQLFAADVDGDLDDDLIASDTASNSVRWIENTAGDGTAWTPHAVGSTPDLNEIAVADFDGDGRPDIVVRGVGGTGQGIGWFANNGNGTGWTLNTITSTVNFISLYPADIDADGDVDVVARRSGFTKPVVWWRNSASGTAWQEVVVAASLSNADGLVRAYDRDLDGDLDIVANSNPTTLFTWTNTDYRGETWSLSTDTFFDATFVLELADVDGDLIKELLYVEAANQALVLGGQIIYNDVQSVPGVAVADFDGDGDRDVAYSSTFGEGSHIAFLPNQSLEPDADAFSRNLIDTNVFGGGEATVVDFDADGDRDVVTASVYDDDVLWYENTGSDYSSWIKRTIDSNFDQAERIAVGDIDKDGDLDVVASSSPGVIYFYTRTNPAGTTFVRSTLHSVSNGTDQLLSLADVDGDTWPDLVCTGNDAIWYRNDQTPGDNPWVATVIDTTARTGAIPGDFDGDGDVDVLVAGGANIGLAENTGGNGSAWTLRTFATTQSSARAFAAFDVDGDLDLDAVGYDNSELCWWENDGTPLDAASWTRHLVDGDVARPQSLAVGDFDGDGDSEFIAMPSNQSGSSRRYVPRYWLNDPATRAAGPWVRGFACHGPGDARGIGVGDLDGNGTADFALMGDSFLEAYVSTRGQVHVETTDLTPPRFPEGKTQAVLELDVSNIDAAGTNSVELSKIRLHFENSQTPGDMTSAQMNALTEYLTLWRDDGDGAFDPAQDDVVTSSTTLSLTAGTQDFTIPVGTASSEIADGSVGTFFLSFTPKSNASSQSPFRFYVDLVAAGLEARNAVTATPVPVAHRDDFRTGLVFCAENQPPFGTISINAGASYANSNVVTANLTRGDAGGGLLIDARFSRDGVNWHTWMGGTTAGASSYSYGFPPAEGPRTLYVQFRDDSGNISSTYSDSISIDTIAPENASLSINGGATYATTATGAMLTMSADPGTGSPLATYRVRNNPGTYTTAAAWTTTRTLNLTASEGIRTVDMEVTDEAGNFAAAQDTIHLDLNPPTGTVAIEGGRTAFNLNTVDLDVTGQDGANGSGVSEMRLSNDGTAWSAWVAFATTYSGWSLDPGTGTKTVHVQLRDAAGRTSVAAINDTIEIDTTPPASSGGQPIQFDGGQTATGAVSVDFSITFTEPVFTVVLGVPQPGLLPSAITLADSTVPTGGFTVSTTQSSRRAPQTWMVNVSGSTGSTGTLTVGLVAGSVVDAAGNSLDVSGLSGSVALTTNVDSWRIVGE